MKLSGKLALAGLGALAVAAPAHASDKRAFEDCDGRIHPAKAKDGMRGEASGPAYAHLLSTDAAGMAAGRIKACTEALASPRLLPTQTLRKAHLLRARAAAHLQAGDSAKAIADLDAAEAAAAPIAADRFYQRSMGVSLKLLRALAMAQGGDVTAALPLAKAAAADRPYALQVQQVAASVLQAGRPLGDESASPWIEASKLAPNAATEALLREAEIGNFKGVLALSPAAETRWPAEPLSPLAFALQDDGMQKLVGALVVSLNTAYARAVAGDAEGARRDLAEVRKHVAAAKPEPEQKETPVAPLLVQAFQNVDDYVDLRARQIEARVAVAEGRTSDAIGALVASPMPKDATTVELIKALKAAVPEKDAALAPDAAPFEAEVTKNRRDSLNNAVQQAMIVPETPRAVVDYEKARPNILGALIGGALTMGTSLLGGINRTDGFRAVKNEDGTTKVEFIGNTPSAALVQEMTLLRAAEVAREAGKPAFVIVDRRDYQRRWVTTQYGVQTSSTPSGYKTELTIRPVEAGAEPARALDAVAIIDSLGPLYYEEKAPAKKR